MKGLKTNSFPPPLFLAMPSVLHFTGLANLFCLSLGRDVNAFSENKSFHTIFF